MLDSLADQSIEEPYEVICVYGESEDDTWEILSQYQNTYPELFRIFDINKTNSGVAEKRNYALRKARGEYVYMCDSDDILQVRALELMYKEAVEFDCDIVYGGCNVMDEDQNGNIQCRYQGPKESGWITKESLICGGVEFWLRLIRKSLLDKCGFLPEESSFDDVAYLPVVHSYANKVRFINKAVYYYFNRSTSTTGHLTKRVCEDSVFSEKYALEHCDPKYRYAVEKFVCQRISYNARNRWEYSDIFINWAKEIYPSIVNNDLIRCDKRLFEHIEWLASRDLFDTNVYADGFAMTPSAARVRELEQKVFHDNCKVAVLSPQNCDVCENDYINAAYENGNKELVGQYFALKSIYENGGVFIHEKIRVLSCFDDCRYLPSFFTFIDKTSYSDKVFGGMAGSKVIKSLLDTFSFGWDKKGGFISLAERIRIILTAEYDVPLNGMDHAHTDPVRVFSPVSMVTNYISSTAKFKQVKVFCEHDFSDEISDDEYVVVKRSTLSLINTGNNTVSKTDPASSGKEKELLRQLDEIKASNSYKFAMKLKKFSNSKAGRPFKCIFMWLTTKCRKHRYTKCRR